MRSVAQINNGAPLCGAIVSSGLCAPLPGAVVSRGFPGVAPRSKFQMNGNKKGKTQRIANQMAALRNEINQLKMQADRRGGNAKPRRRKAKAKLDYDIGVPQGGLANGNNLAHFAPLSTGYTIKSLKPIVTRAGYDEQRIIHREKIARVSTTGAGNFAIQSRIALNPGLAASFPWLANEANGWETYRFNRMRFIWVPSGGASVAGNVIMGADYDASDGNPAGEAALSSYADAEESALWVMICADCDPRRLNGTAPRRFVRNGALAANLDVKLYDSGNFFVATTDDSAVVVAKLWVEYDVSLFTPQVPSGGFFQTGTLQGAGGSLAAATPFGAAPVVTGAPALSGAATSTLSMTGLVIGQEYALTIQLVGTVISVVSPAATTGMTFVTSAVSMNNAAATASAAFVTFTATAETATSVVTVTATTITASRVVLANLAPVPAF